MFGTYRTEPVVPVDKQPFPNISVGVAIAYLIALKWKKKVRRMAQVKPKPGGTKSVFDRLRALGGFGEGFNATNPNRIPEPLHGDDRLKEGTTNGAQEE